MEKTRLDKLISNFGMISRKEVKNLIRKGLVTVNGVCAGDAGQYVSYNDIITVAGKRLNSSKHIYIMLNKPAGVVSATEDAKLPTVVDILPDEYRRNDLFPAGRLDRDTTGFCLITDDGDFAHDILTPAHHVVKTYEVETDVAIDYDLAARKFAEGVVLDDGTVLLSAALIRRGEKLFTVKIREGRYHQIKRMFASVGAKVVSLHRTAIGGLTLDENLSPGQSRLILPEELEIIRHFDE